MQQKHAITSFIQSFGYLAVHDLLLSGPLQRIGTLEMTIPVRISEHFYVLDDRKALFSQLGYRPRGYPQR
ncbi:hypothetical protein D3C76_1839810 [compost metagenome]